ncbi:MAG: DUF1570 domain-containing protein [Pirellulales bacterium]|nr:DUF1570 domain-containing protein [Pirellulales bacterium]
MQALTPAGDDFVAGRTRWQARGWLSMVLAICGQMILPLTLSAEPPRVTFELTLAGERLEGRPLAWSEDNVLLLTRAGALKSFHPNQATDFRQTARDFTSYPASVMKARLEAELGHDFTVTSTGHFLVATQSGKARAWAERFEEMYRSFVMYFQVRGFQLAEPEFPLVAVVLDRQADFIRYSTNQGVAATPEMLGYYLGGTNRVALFDLDGGKSTRNWQQNMATIVHEAAHQAAFNTGIHNRWSPPPRWVAEGLGTMFEAPGVWDSRGYPRREDRINRDRLAQFRTYVKERRPEDALLRLIADDRFFDADPDAGYAEAWAFTFFLVEQHPREYARYLQLTANREAFTDYPPQARLTDFVSVFGKDFRLLNARYLRFMEELR